ncbi:MAG: hypothetical protein ATN36_05035 [Epulopiscium sp. Nele67-Bin005]|nr:MAG: hypothetical protein ATN36_05035 [Epulopiscium sp. Nele67-Bin005]
MDRLKGFKTCMLAAFIITGVPTFATEVGINTAIITQMSQTRNIETNEVIVLEQNEEVEVLSKVDDKYKVLIDDEIIAYVKQDNLEIKVEEKSTVASLSGSLANNIVSYAKQFIGTPYSYGGTTLGRGVDCSGFTSQVFKGMGISIPRTSKDQYRYGTTVSRDNLQPGDLVFYGYSGSVSHVALYIGNSQIIHASSSRGVEITSLSMNSSMPIIGYKRVV